MFVIMKGLSSEYSARNLKKMVIQLDTIQISCSNEIIVRLDYILLEAILNRCPKGEGFW